MTTLSRIGALAPFLTLLALAGCADYASRGGADSGVPEYVEDPLWSADDDDAGGTGDDDETEGPVLESVDPVPDSSDHHYRDPITARFSGSAVGASLDLFDRYGAAVESTIRWSEGWDEAVLVPVVPLEPNALYEVEIRLGRSDLTYGFVTSEVGLPVADPASLDGRTFQLDFGAARWHDPGPLGFVLGDAGPAHWLWQVHQLGEPSVEAGQMYFDFGLGRDSEAGAYEQDVCALSERFGAPEGEVVRAGSYFGTAPADMAVAVGQDLFVFEQAWLDGDFTADGEALANIGFAGWLQVDSVNAVLAIEDDACEILQDQGLACATCPSGAGRCIFVDVDHVSGRWQSDLALEPVDADGIEVNSECAGVDPGFSCSTSGAARPGLAGLLGLFGLVAILLRRD